MTAPHWFFRFMNDRESAAWGRRRNEREHRELGCGPGAHAPALARRGYDVTGVDGSSRMVEVARTRAARDKVDATFAVHDVSAPLRFADASLGGPRPDEGGSSCRRSGRRQALAGSTLRAAASTGSGT
jgi:SAM-dependent methyltransferase